MLCCVSGRTLDFRLLFQIRRFASVCLARNIKISIRWTPSEVNSSDRGSREHDNAYDSTKSLVDHLGSSDGWTIAVSHTCSDREPSRCEEETLTAPDGVAVDRDFSPGTLSAVAEETECSLRFELASDKAERSGRIQPPHDGGLREAGPSAKRLRRVWHRGSPGGRGQQCRQQQRRREADHRTRSCLAATRTSSVARAIENGRNHVSRGQTSEHFGQSP